ncbi:hypothetical protein quinque_013406 [Culex quinquefasciatus]
MGPSVTSLGIGRTIRWNGATAGTVFCCRPRVEKLLKELVAVEQAVVRPFNLVAVDPRALYRPFTMMEWAVVDWAVVEWAVVERAVVERAVVERAVVERAVVERAVVKWAVVEWAVVERALVERPMYRPFNMVAEARALLLRFTMLVGEPEVFRPFTMVVEAWAVLRLFTVVSLEAGQSNWANYPTVENAQYAGYGAFPAPSPSPSPQVMQALLQLLYPANQYRY